MAVKWNRLISIEFLNDAGIVTDSIPCPVKGRKPNIEINGNFTTKSYLPAFNIAVRNLYVDITDKQYKRLRVQAGYEDNYIEIEGTILTMYQETPGPESKTIIQCQSGNLTNWLNATVDINKEANTPLKDTLQEISNALKMTGQMKLGLTAQTMTLTNGFVFQGSATEAITKLTKEYTEAGLVIIERDNALYAYAEKKGDSFDVYPLDFISGPPQQNAGEEGTVYGVITAPWNPNVRPGDRVKYPAMVYLKNLAMSNETETSIVVNTVQFQFSTTGSANTMTVMGAAV